MKTFVISLVSETSRRSTVSKECEQRSLNFEIVDAINGRALAPSLFETLTFDSNKNALTKGEVGCALSHMHVYSKMSSQGLACALVLEDDAQLSPEINYIISDIENVISKKKPEIYLLTGNCLCSKFFRKESVAKNKYFRVLSGSGGHGYVINLQAAKKIMEGNLPVKLEADRWVIFRDMFNIKVWSTNSACIRSSCTEPNTSTIGSERDVVSKERGVAINKIKHTIPSIQIKRIINLLIKKTGVIIVK